VSLLESGEARRVRLHPDLGAALLAFLVTLLVGMAWVVYRGPHQSPDSRGFYGPMAERLIAAHFDYGRVLAEGTRASTSLFYFGYATLVALCKLVFGSAWAHGCVTVNCFAVALTAAQLVYLVLATTGSRGMSLAALVWIVACPDLYLWTPLVLTDAGFLALTFSAFTILGLGVLKPAAATGIRYYLPLTAVLLLALTWKPQGLVLLPCVAFGLWLQRHCRRAGELRPSGALFRRVALLILGTSMVLILMNALLMQNPQLVPFSWDIHRVSREWFEMGHVVSGRPETYHGPPVHLGDYALISLDRLAHYFVFWARGFSRTHNLMNTLWFLPVYLAIAPALLALFRTKSPLEEGTARVAALSVVFIAAFAVFHALIQVDFDWRYRVPVLPHLILLACFGCALLTSAARRRGVTAVLAP
jgi:hypothetical protein